MANINNNGENGNSFLGFIVGGLLVVVVILAILYYNGSFPGMKSETTSVTVETPAAPATETAPAEGTKK